MRIREIDLVGFKSFRDPTKLKFGSGMNAIVGPNGCGKSNVSDAIRWALGEQSVKNLRARDMSDIIFGGNQASAPLNFAEVTLTFERTGEGDDATGEEEGLAAQVARLPEFSVTRRLYRSGESQYLVNQAPARLRDITEIFLGSGLGPKAYAMIEQGRVMQMVNAKPEELRLFIEEAAGTTRFRSRKLAAERKLDRTTENLSRVNDVMREIERQLGALQRQAKRAEEFKRLEAELRDVEICLAGARFGLLAEERSGCQSESEGLSGAAAVIDEKLAALVAQRDAAQVRDRETEEAIERMFAALADVASAVVRATERETATREALSSVEERLERAREEDEGLARQESELRGLLDGAVAERARSEAELAVAEERLQRADAAVLEAAPVFDAAESSMGAARSELGHAQSAAAATAERRAEMAARYRGLEEEGVRIEERLAGRKGELETASARVSEVSEREQCARGDHDRLADNRKQAAEALRVREDELRRVEEAQARLRESLLHVGGRIDGLREREKSLDGYADGIDAILSRPDGPLGLLVECLEIPEELEPAAAAVLGDVLRGAVVEGPEDGARLAEALRHAGEGRISFVPRRGGRPAGSSSMPPGCRPLASLLTAREGYADTLEALFGDVVLADDLATAVSAYRANAGSGTWVTRAGDLVDERGVVTGGEAPAGVDLLERRRVLSELEAQQEKDQADLAVLESRLGEVREVCGRMGQDLQQLDARAHDATLELVAAEHALEASRRERAAAEQRIAEAEEEARQSRTALTTAEDSLEEVAAAARQAAARGVAAEAALAGATEELEAARERFERVQAEREASRQAMADIRQVVTQAVAEQARQQHAFDVLVSRRGSIREESDRLLSEHEAAMASLTGLASEVESAREQHAARETEVERARADAREIRAELETCESAVGEARQERDAQRERLNQLEVRVASLDAQIDGIAESVRERHEVAISEVLVPEDFDSEVSAERATALKTRIERLGAVNVTAIDDAQELEERHGFLLEQRSDLETSIEDLRKTIGELSRTTRTRFKDTFEQARELFAKTFQELFRGGRADLVLTQPNNLLETGVEIAVQPPGKALRNLGMLSGGEKSLTAVSLIMSLFALRSTPFCLLDEVDAPLDEANVGRFSSLLKRMSRDTQFLIITHKQRTMESSDSLYGVTMPEPGVSQIVSVEMEDAAEAARSGGMAASA